MVFPSGKTPPTPCRVDPSPLRPGWPSSWPVLLPTSYGIYLVVFYSQIVTT